jgi:hypothetical protein
MPGRGATVIPSNTTALVHESMRDAELQASEDIGAIGVIDAGDAIGANEFQRQVVKAGAGREVSVAPLQCNGSAQAGVVAGFRAGRGPRLGRTLALLGRAGMPNNMPVALMSSSMSGQCSPNPLPMNSLLRWAGVASDKRHDQAKGTLMTRPSARCATIDVQVQRTSDAPYCVEFFSQPLRDYHTVEPAPP